MRKHRAFLVLLALACVLFTTNLGAYRQFARAESYFALGARSMLAPTGDWLAPHAPDETILNKPPLQYWLIGLSYKLVGAERGDYMAARLPSSLTALLVLAFVYFYGALFFGRNVGLLAAALLATSLIFWSFARLAMSDMLLALCVTASFFFFSSALADEQPAADKFPRSLTPLAGYAALACGLLTKGPIAFLLIFVPLCVEIILRRERAAWRRMRPFEGACVCALIAAPYFLLLYARQGAAPLRFFFVGENWQRFSGALYEFGTKPWWYAVVSFFGDFAPWSPLIYLAAWQHFKDRTKSGSSERRALRLLYIWMLFPVLFFSISHFKRDYYLLPALPAAALLVAHFITHVDLRSALWLRRAVKAMMIAITLGGTAAAFLTGRILTQFFVAKSAVWIPAAIGCALVCAVVLCAAQTSARFVVLVTAFFVWAVLWCGELFLLPVFARAQPAMDLALAAPSGTKIYTSWAASGWANDLAFNLPANQIVQRLVGDVDNRRLQSILQNEPQIAALMWEDEYERLQADNGAARPTPRLRILAAGETFRNRGFNLNAKTVEKPGRLLLVEVSDAAAANNVVEFERSLYEIAEDGGDLYVTIARRGDTSSEASVAFQTSDAAGEADCAATNGAASARCDYVARAGTLRFAAGESAQTFRVPIIDDGYHEGDENFTLTLTTSNGVRLGVTKTARVVIKDNDATNADVDPLDTDAFFIRQLSLDLFSLAPESANAAEQLSRLRQDKQMGEARAFCARARVAASLFNGTEYQARGAFVYLFYRVVFGRAPRYLEYAADIAKLNGANSADAFEILKNDYAAEWIGRENFIAAYDVLSPQAFVEKLERNAGVHLAEENQLRARLASGESNRVAILRRVIEGAEVKRALSGEAFVAAQYFSLWRRDVDDSFSQRVQRLAQTGDECALINSFLTAPEYRARFAPAR